MSVIEFDAATAFLTGSGATSGTPQSLDAFLDTTEALGSTKLTRGVWVKNDSASTTNKILVKENKDASGYPLAAGEQVFVQIDDLKKVWVVAGANTPTVWFLAY